MEYVGTGVSSHCRDAVMRLIQHNVHVTKCRILTASQSHCLLLTINDEDLVAVRRGFTSGYIGEGPRTLSYVLSILDALDVEIEEYDVNERLLRRVDDAALTSADLSNIEKSRPVHPARWPDYIYDAHWDLRKERMLWGEFPLVIPLGLVDPRIVDLALSFMQDPDQKLVSAYRRFEDTLRARVGSENHGYDLIKEAFAPDKGHLTWNGIQAGERSGRFQVIAGAFLAYRNRRAHTELEDSLLSSVSEFLLINHVYLLERSAVPATK